MVKKKFDFSSCEALIWQGKPEEVRKALRSLTPSRLPRAQRLQVANLARRANLNYLSLNILNKAVRKSQAFGTETSSAEKIEYAASLQRLGALSESAELLGEIDLKRHPIAYLYLGFQEIFSWNYQASVPYFKSLLNSDIEDSRKRAALLNLSQAYVYEDQFDLADGTIDDLLSKIDTLQDRVIFGNLMELRAQILIKQGKFNTATKLLNSTAKDLHGIQRRQFFIQKWLKIAEAMKSKNLNSIFRLRKLAIQKRHFETIRDCDYYQAILTKNRDLFNQAYFGSPFHSFKKKLKENFPIQLDIPKSYIWLEKKASNFIYLDIQSGIYHQKKRRSQSLFPSGHLLQKLLYQLTSDMYRPTPTAGLFSKIYPKEYFDPYSSPLKVRQLIKRLRNILLEHSCEITINTEKNGYFLKPAGNCGIKLYQTESYKTNKLDYILSEIELEFGFGEFTSKESQTLLNVSSPTMSRILKSGITEGKVDKIGNGPSSKYKLRRV